MSQGGSRRPYSRGGPRWHPRYKDYWDYEQNYSDGSSGGSPKECTGPSPPPHAPAPTPHHHKHPHHDRRIPMGGAAGGSRRAERRPAGPSDRRRPVGERERAGSGAGPSHEAAHHTYQPHHHGSQHAAQHSTHHAPHAPHPHLLHAPHHHHLDTNPLEGPVEGAGSSDGELSPKHGEPPARKRRRVSRHLPAAEPPAPLAPPPAARPHRHYTHQPPRRMRYVSGGGAVWAHERILEPHHAPLLLDINPMSLRGRLGALPAPAWHAPHRDPHPPRNQVGVGAALGAELWPPAAAVLPLRYQMGSVYAGVGYGAFPPAPRGPFASPPHAHHHYIPSQRAEGGRLDGVTEGGLSPPDLHHAPLLLHTEARGTAIELMAPHHAHHAHHARHALQSHHRRGGGGGGSALGVGVVGAARPYVRHAARYAHHPLHHIHTQSGGLVGAALGAHVSAGLAVAPPLSLPPPPTYQVFLNLLAMFPVSGYGGGEARDEAADSPETENYEALLSLAERLGEAKPRGLQRHEIDLLPTYKYCEQTHTGEQSMCVVCMCEFEARQSLRVLPCAHEFHAKCVDKWLRSNRTCPICRGNASDYFNHSE